MSNASNSDSRLPVDINALSFDTFGRNPQRDIVCITPIRTVIRREEEIVLVRKVRKVEEIEAPLACPTNSFQASVDLENPASIQRTSPPSATPPAPVVDQTSVTTYEEITEPKNPFPDLADVVTPVEPVTARAAVTATMPAAPTISTSGSAEAKTVADWQPNRSQTLSGLAPEQLQELIVDSRQNCYRFSPEAMERLQSHTASTQLLAPGLYTITLKSGTFDYRAPAGKPGEPLVLLWLYGGRVINRQTGVPVGATWSSLNGYGDHIVLEVLEPTTLCAFFFDTYVYDNQGEVTLTVEGNNIIDELTVNSQTNCYYIDANTMQSLEEVAATKQLPAGRYAIQLKSGEFGYRTESGHAGEPLVLLWIYGGKIRNHATDVEVNSTWVSLNGHGDTLMLDVLEPATLCGFFYDTYLEDNEGQVKLSIENIV